MTRALPFLLLAACGSTGPEARVALCLGADAEVSPEVADDFLQVWSFTGEVVDADVTDEVVFDVQGCSRDATPRTVAIRDDEERTWFLGVDITRGEERITPPLGLLEGERVTASFVLPNDWAQARGVVVQDAEGRVALAADEGWSWAVDALTEHLDEDPMAGITVEEGSTYGPTRRDACGRQRSETQVFTADEAVTLEVGEQARIPHQGTTLTAWNVSAWTFLGQVTCTDTWGPEAWMLYRGGAGD